MQAQRDAGSSAGKNRTTGRTEHLIAPALDTAIEDASSAHTSDDQTHDDTENASVAAADVTDDAIASTASPTSDASAPAADGETESHGTGVPGVVSAPRSRHTGVAADAEGVSP